MFDADFDEMHHPHALNDLEKAAKDLTHVKILNIGDNILDEREMRYQEEKQKAVAEAQAAVKEKMKRKFEREIVKRLEECKAQHKIELSNLLDNTEERVQEEIAKREAKLQTEMSEQLRNLQNKMSQEMQTALDQCRRKHSEELSSEMKKTVSAKEAESVRKLEEAKKTYEQQKEVLRREMEQICIESVEKCKQEGETKLADALAEKDVEFLAQMAAAIEKQKRQHVEDLELVRAEIGKRETYVAKLHKAIEFLRNSRRELSQMTLDVHEQMKFFIDRTKPFTDGNAQFLVPRLDLSKFAAEPDVDPTY